MRTTLKRLLVVAVFSGALVGMAPAAFADSVTVTVPGIPGTPSPLSCTKTVTVGWNIPPDEGEKPVYTDGNVTCT